VKLVRYIGIQLQCKLSVPLNDRTVELNSYPRLSDWLYLVNLRKDVIQPVDYNLKYLLTPQIPERLANDWLSDPLVRGRDCRLNNGVFMELGHWKSSCKQEGHSARYAAECEGPPLPGCCGS
ncbi:Kinase suppressor of Ras 1, partial [Ophiophagus hannah]